MVLVGTPATGRVEDVMIGLETTNGAAVATGIGLPVIIPGTMTGAAKATGAKQAYNPYANNARSARPTGTPTPTPTPTPTALLELDLATHCLITLSHLYPLSQSH
mgnify:CR=1 FL=1